MIERVARALEAKITGKEFVSSEDAARAAIEAMRDSLSPEMATAILEGDSFIDWANGREADREEWYGNYEEFRAGWQKAFDAALKEGS